LDNSGISDLRIETTEEEADFVIIAGQPIKVGQVFKNSIFVHKRFQNF